MVVSGLINSVISLGFFLAAFGGTDLIALWGVGNFAFDFLPQSFAIGLMATLVPGLLWRRALGSAAVRGMTAAQPTVWSIFACALLRGLVAAVAGAAFWSAVLWLSGAQSIAYWPALLLKVAYGAALGAVVTWITLGRVLRAP